MLTGSSIDSSASSLEIDRQVQGKLSQGLSLYDVQETLLREVAPDLVITQDTCDLCAVSFTTVQQSVARLLGHPHEIVSLSPVSVEDVLEDIRRVARAAGVAGRGDELVAALEVRLAELRQRTAGLEPRRVLPIEWLDPPMTAGHWTPRLIEWAGGIPVLGHDGRSTVKSTWADLAASDPDLVLLAPCGFSMEQGLRELDRLVETSAAFREMPAVVRGDVAVLDGNAYFNRPGPRIVDSAWWAAKAIHPDAFGDLADDSRVLRFPLKNRTTTRGATT